MANNELYTFVAEKALNNSPFTLYCNCGGCVHIYPLIQENQVICPKCESIIHILVLKGDPGYVFGSDPKGNPMLLPVQGSSAKPIEHLTVKEREEILSKVVIPRENEK
jgi:hypothetical protein